MIGSTKRPHISAAFCYGRENPTNLICCVREILVRIARVALAVKQDEAQNPLHVLRLGANAVMLDADTVAYLIERFWAGRVSDMAFLIDTGLKEAF